MYGRDVIGDDVSAVMVRMSMFDGKRNHKSSRFAMHQL